ncbi:hypothetical protein FSP39_003895 [Pinctada imbricata]|uniref:Uncharacterized protein n=1 Tax=Pinctada imbricata TaxID=66713 RepID=A0AA88YWJ8_PINIB|nr:hypothetical protein FSP39_003895 [Pinctada imbricata]
MNAHWNDNKIYNEARKIVGAIIQHITYKEYLLNVLNDPTREKYGLKLSNTGFVDEYEASVNPTIKNAFAAAAYRFGHSMIPPVEGLKKKNNRLVEDEFLEQIFLDQDFLLQKSARAVEMLAQYAITEPSREVDRFFESAIRNRLFENVEDVGFDLTALNIQRGRDHGLPAYVDWRVYCELDTEKLISFQELHLTHDQHAIEQLGKAYANVRDIDLYAGAMSEQRLPNSYVGPTFSCLIGEQFEALKKGDRFWYEMPTRQGFKEGKILQSFELNNLKMIEAKLNLALRTSDLREQSHDVHTIF